MLPYISGFELCKKINEKHNIPIILLTAKTDIVDKVLGLELGADDYLTKPFDNRELLARVKALIRRSSQTPTEDLDIIENGDLKIIPNERRVLVDSEEIHLTPKAVSYTHLDVYKRQTMISLVEKPTLVTICRSSPLWFSSLYTGI